MCVSTQAHLQLLVILVYQQRLALAQRNGKAALGRLDLHHVFRSAGEAEALVAALIRCWDGRNVGLDLCAAGGATSAVGESITMTQLLARRRQAACRAFRASHSGRSDECRAGDLVGPHAMASSGRPVPHAWRQARTCEASASMPEGRTLYCLWTRSPSPLDLATGRRRPFLGGTWLYCHYTVNPTIQPGYTAPIERVLVFVLPLRTPPDPARRGYPRTSPDPQYCKIRVA